MLNWEPKIHFPQKKPEVSSNPIQSEWDFLHQNLRGWTPVIFPQTKNQTIKSNQVIQSDLLIS